MGDSRSRRDDQYLKRQRTDKAVFTRETPTDPSSEVKMAEVSAESENYKVGLIWPEQILPQQPITSVIQITDKSDALVSAASYELLLADKAGNEVTRSGAVTTPLREYLPTM